MAESQRIRNIFLDFDGVILDSEAIKDAGFAHIFRNFSSQAVSALMRFHKENGGVSRYDKIRYFYQEILAEPLSKAEMGAHADEFSQFVSERLCSPDQLIPDTHNFIKKYFQDFELYVVSAADQSELRWLCSTLGIAPCFREILGSPGTKSEILGRALSACKSQDSLGIMIGDSINDYKAAMHHKVRFFGYNNPHLRNLPSASYLDSFDDLPSLLSQL
jgi:phosphoglycolate phosphatase-like HAD superfamily hydrolase